ncbi:MAG: hypothetical protein IRZ13_02820 [Acetobacteraceae bacterium]|nr:hypothetical protein [Acetobacteraceae bacterium]
MRQGLPNIQRRRGEILRRRMDGTATAQDVRLDRLLGELEQHRRQALAQDPLATAAAVHARQGRLGFTELAPIDPEAGVNGLIETLRVRQSQAAILGRLEGIADMPLFTRTESEAIAQRIERGSPEEQAQFLRALAAGLGADRMKRTLASLMPRGNGREARDTSPRFPAFIVAGAVAERGQERLAGEILRGTYPLQYVSPPALVGHDFEAAARSHLGGAFAHVPQTEAMIVAAVRAVYAERVGSGFDPADESRSRTREPTIHERSMKTALVSRIVNKVAPTVEFRGRRLPAPRGLSQQDSDAEMARMPPEALLGARATDGRAVTPDMVRRYGNLVAVGEDRYHIIVNGAFYVTDETGTWPFVLDMRRPWPETPLAAVDMPTERHTRAFAFFVSQGRTVAQTVGLVANLHHESHVRHDAPAGDGGASVGMLQWHGPRRAEFRRVMGKPVEQASFDDQLRFIQYELTERAERAAGEAPRAARTAAEAGTIASRRYVRPRDVEGEARSRGRTAAAYAARLGRRFQGPTGAVPRIESF